MNTITPQDLSAKMQTKTICMLDVRAREKYENEHIQHENIQSINIPKSIIFDLEEENTQAISVLPKNKEIIVTCTTGNSAKKCATILAEKGYEVTLLEGGITSWKAHQQPGLK